MTKHEFMFRLEKALSGLSENEKNEALRYYDDYLSDCGSDNLADVLSQLGSPEKLAEEIKNEPAEPMTREEHDKKEIMEALEKANGRRREAAIALGISDRTLYRRLKQYGLD